MTFLMNKYYTFTFLLLCLTFGTNGLQAQIETTRGGRGGATEGRQMGIELTPGDHAPEEVIIRFNTAPSLEERGPITSDLKDVNIYVQEWSPSGKFLRADAPLLTDCEYDGNGNPDAGTLGGGDQISLNYYANSRGWYDYNRFYYECVPVNGFNDPGIGDEGDVPPPNEYHPTLWCSDDASLVPLTGKRKVKMVIIDSGLKLPGNGMENGVNYNQTIIPGDCALGDCDPIYEGIDEVSNDFHPHGSYIFDLVSRWFDAEGLAPLLNVSSYQVLDEELKGTIFQVIKAIELATMEKEQPQVISLSIGFRPLHCSDSSNPVTEPGDNTVEDLHSPLYYAIKDAEEKNIIVVTSAGNDNRNLNVSPQYPAAETGIDNLVTVGGLMCGSNNRAPWSNYSNKHIDLFAPGAQIKVAVRSCYASISGTSFACPIVATKAAFHVTAQEEYDDKEVLCLLRSQATPFADAKYGIVNVAASQQSCDKGAKSLLVKPVAAAPTVKVSPNPFNHQLIIRTGAESAASPATLTVIDGQGRVVARRQTNTPTTTLDVAHLTPGVYWLNVTTAAGSETRKIIKQ